MEFTLKRRRYQEEAEARTNKLAEKRKRKKLKQQMKKQHKQREETPVLTEQAHHGQSVDNDEDNDEESDERDHEENDREVGEGRETDASIAEISEEEQKAETEKQKVEPEA